LETDDLLSLPYSFVRISSSLTLAMIPSEVPSLCVPRNVTGFF